jgi:hypothetical protein
MLIALSDYGWSAVLHASGGLTAGRPGRAEEVVLRSAALYVRKRGVQQIAYGRIRLSDSARFPALGCNSDHATQIKVAAS